MVGPEGTPLASASTAGIGPAGSSFVLMPRLFLIIWNAGSLGSTWSSLAGVAGGGGGRNSGGSAAGGRARYGRSVSIVHRAAAVCATVPLEVVADGFAATAGDSGTAVISRPEDFRT